MGVIFSSDSLASIEDIRLMGVLQRIAICYFFTGILYSTIRIRGLIIVCSVLLVGYWALMTFVPVPGYGAGNFQKGANLANYIDKHYLPLSKYDGDYDPEGLLSTLPALSTCLLGVFAGRLLKNENYKDQEKVRWLLMGGVAGVLMGFLWGIQFPVIKKIWTWFLPSHRNLGDSQMGKTFYLDRNELHCHLHHLRNRGWIDLL
jgi:predicted acyltransferase